MKHHGDLPDMMPNDDNSILSGYEVSNLYAFLDKEHISFGLLLEQYIQCNSSLI